MSKEDILESISKSLLQGGILCIETILGDRIDRFPHRLAYLGGELSLIGERPDTGNLTTLEIKHIRFVKHDDKVSYQPGFSSGEVDRFLKNLRVVLGNEERLVLKLDASQKVDLTPSFQFWGNPCLVSNSKGDLIWAASVEVNEELLKWLAGIRDRVHILEPTLIKTSLKRYLAGKQGRV